MQTNVNSESKELCRFLATPGIEVANLMFAGDDVVWISWKLSAEEQMPSLRHTNGVIGSYFNAGSRIHLYRYPVRLHEKANYCDTFRHIHSAERRTRG